MKKFISFCVIALLAGMLFTNCSSCSKPNVQFGIEYSLQSDGLANGDVEMTFEGGQFNINGTADYVLRWSNTVLLNEVEAPLLSDALVSNDSETAETAKKVNNWLESSIKVESASGTYDIYVKGYVKEIATGLVFSIDRHFTNIPVNETIDYE